MRFCLWWFLSDGIVTIRRLLLHCIRLCVRHVVNLSILYPIQYPSHGGAGLAGLAEISASIACACVLAATWWHGSHCR